MRSKPVTTDRSERLLNSTRTVRASSDWSRLNTGMLLNHISERNISTSSSKKSLSGFPLCVCARLSTLPLEKTTISWERSAFLRRCPIFVNNIPALGNKSNRKIILTVQSRSSISVSLYIQYIFLFSLLYCTKLMSDIRDTCCWPGETPSLFGAVQQYITQ